MNKFILSAEQIDFDSLLHRQSITVDNRGVIDYLRNKTVFITGGCGSIGSEIVRQLLNLGIDHLVIYDNSECGTFNLKYEIDEKYHQHQVKFYIGDVTDMKRLHQVLWTHQPNIIFHVAAYKHVPIMEENAYESIKVNVIGTKNVADCALACGVEKFIMVSTDKAVNPTNIMGVSKRISELYVNHLNHFNKTQYITTRFGNVLGSSGSVIPTFIKRINRGQNLQITHREITRYFMTIPEAAQLVIHATILCESSDILMFDMGQPVKIYDLARNLLDTYMPNSGLTIDIIGLRPGEKLYEELLCNGENVIPTTNKFIMKSKHKQAITENFLQKYHALISCESILTQDLKPLLKELVPEYK
jgi:FlaA1/EpsC-like NDP-sugar epimerase